VRIPLDTDDMEPTPPQTESARERGFDMDVDPADFGRSETEGDDHPGDIADEGSGHRN
jgi:hypothetical protein